MNRRTILTLGAGLALAGCGLSERPYVERREWPLLVTRADPLPAPRRGRVLLVRSIRAAPGLDARGLQSLRPDGSMRTDFYEEWAVPPAQGVEDALRQWLAGSGLFAAVVAPGSRLNADLVLEGDLTAFWADIPAMRARATLAVVLLDQGRGPASILLQRTFTAEAPLANAGAPAVAAGLTAALAEVFGQVEDAIRARTPTA